MKTFSLEATTSDAWAWLGLKARAWAWLEGAWASQNPRPGPVGGPGPGLGLHAPVCRIAQDGVSGQGPRHNTRVVSLPLHVGANWRVPVMPWGIPWGHKRARGSEGGG